MNRSLQSNARWKIGKPADRFVAASAMDAVDSNIDLVSCVRVLAGSATASVDRHEADRSQIRGISTTALTPNQPLYTSHLASRISHLASRISHLASRISHLASRISHLASRISQHLASRISHLASRIPHLVMPTRRALIIVDLNNDFMPGGALAVKGADEMLGPINELAAEGRYDYVVATQDWHPEDHISFDNWPAHCVAGSPGADLHPLFDTKHVQAVIRKGFASHADSYSGFYDEKGSSNGLAELLRAHQIAEVDVVGIATDYCVKATAIDASQKANFKTRVLLHACRGVGLQTDDISNAIEEMKAAGVEVC